MLTLCRFSTFAPPFPVLSPPEHHVPIVVARRRQSSARLTPIHLNTPGAQERCHRGRSSAVVGRRETLSKRVEETTVDCLLRYTAEICDPPGGRLAGERPAR